VSGGRVTIPQDLRERAFRAANGELAWVEGDALGVVNFAEQNGVAVLGGEVWFIGTDGAVISSVRSRDGVFHVYAWSTCEVENEGLAGFVGRCAQDSRDAITAFRKRAGPAYETAGTPMFNLTFDRDVE